MLVRLHGQIIINSGDLPCELGFLPSKTYWELAKSFPILFLPRGNCNSGGHGVAFWGSNVAFY